MGQIYQSTHKYINTLDADSVIVEIGSERGEGSTAYFSKLAQSYGVPFHTVDILDHAQQKVADSTINWHVCDGATWCRNEYPKINKKISVLYLDNFDLVYNPGTIHNPLWTRDLFDRIRGESWPEQFDSFENMPDWVKQETLELLQVTEEEIHHGIYGRYQHLGFELNNNICQQEHFKQLIALFPYLTDNCTVVFDDTFLAHDCWIGKNGPGVIFLQIHGFKIIAQEQSGVLLQRNT